jgi:hypothetical protein
MEPKQKTLEKIRKTLEDTGIGNIFLNRILIAQEIKARIDKWDYIKIKRFCTSKTVTRIKRQPKVEEIFNSYSTDKGLNPEYIELKKLNSMG